MNDQGRAGTSRPDPLLSFHIRRLGGGGGRLSTTDPYFQQKFRDRQNVIAQRIQQERYKVEPYRPAAAVLPDGAWKGESCFLLAGGPSLRGFEFERLRGRGRIIAINRAFEFALFADIVFFMDKKFYKLYHDGRFPDRNRLWTSFAGLKIFLNLSGYRFEDCYSIRSLGRNGLSSSIAKGLFHGNNSGHGALNLAFALGASPIYLLGYDMKTDALGAHFHSGYGAPVRDRTVRGFVLDLERQKRFVERTSAKVVNLNPGSALRCYPFSTVDEVLNDREARENLGNDDAPLLEPDDRTPPA